MGKKLVVNNIDCNNKKLEVLAGEDILMISSHGADVVSETMLEAAGEYPGHAVYGLAERGAVLVTGKGIDAGWAVQRYEHDKGMQSAMEDTRVCLMEHGCRKCETGQSSLYYMADTEEEAEEAYDAVTEKFENKFCIVKESGCRIFVFPSDADNDSAVKRFCEKYGYGCMRQG